MKNRCFSITICLLLKYVAAPFVFSQDLVSPEFNEAAPRGAEGTVVHGLIGGTEILFANGINMSINILYSNITGKYPWATPTAEAIRGNFTIPWQWEDIDGFVANQLGHPYQASIYYNAGRVNGFGFYESTLFSAFGSFVWEAFCESNHASINDFITTVTSSLSMGEMLYRLYLEAHAAGIPAPLVFFISPMAGFHHLMTRTKPPFYGRNLYGFRAHFGLGYAQTHYYVTKGTEDLFSFRGFFADLGFQAVYGNPFEQESRVPFSHFELAMSLSLDIGNYMNFRIISDGFLFSFSPMRGDKNTMSTGLTLHLDSVALGKIGFEERGSSTINQYSNALDWTIKYQRHFAENLVFQTRFHFGFTFLGASQYYSLEKGRDLLNYGGGLNSKVFFTFDHRKLGKLEVNIFGYALWTYPGTTALSRGTVFWFFTDVAYSYIISDHLSLGIANSLTLERGFFSGNPDTHKCNNAVKLFVAWNY